jgi:hypothetical protein
MREQRNALFDAIEENGLDVNDFGLDAEDGITYVRHRPSESAFSVQTTDGLTFHGSYKVGDAGWYGYQPAEWYLLLIDHFDRWIRLVKREAETPDKWEILRVAGEFLARLDQADLSNERFTAAEQSQITSTLDEIKTYIVESRALSAAQAVNIEKKIEHLEKASERFGRKDYAMLFFGTVLSALATVGLPPTVIQHVFMMAVHGLGHLFIGGGRMPLPPRP